MPEMEKGQEMGRLIDADIMKKAIIATKEKTNSYADHVVCDFALEMLAAVKTEDAVKVIRCKNCKHWLKDVPGCTEFIGRCEFANYMIGSMGFCFYGERRSDD